jgi:hypothetical protein
VDDPSGAHENATVAIMAENTFGGAWTGPQASIRWRGRSRAMAYRKRAPRDCAKGFGACNAILEAGKEPVLIRNDSETARKILALKLPELQKGNGVQLGFDAITWHLRQVRAAKPIVSASKT